MTAEANVADLRKLMGLPSEEASSDSEKPTVKPTQRVRRQSMEQLNLMKVRCINCLGSRCWAFDFIIIFLLT